MPYLSMTYEDDYGRTTKRLVQIESEALLADYVAVAAVFGAAVEKVTDLGLVRMDLIIPMTAEGFAVTAGGNLDVGATFVGWTDATPPHKAVTKLPGIKATYVAGDGTIDIANADIEDYLEQFIEASGEALLSDGEHITAWLRGTLDR